MSTTLDFFNATKAQPVATSPGRLTLEEAVCLFDALTAIRVTCSHVLQSSPAIPPGQTLAESHPHLQRLIDQIPNGKSTIARTVRVLKLWYRWTHQFHGEQVPDVHSVQSFLFAVANA